MRNLKKYRTIRNDSKTNSNYSELGPQTEHSPKEGGSKGRLAMGHALRCVGIRVYGKVGDEQRASF